MYFKRKVYDKLLEWKKIYSEKYAVLLEGARRVGKSTIAETFAKNEYRSYILIDFSKTTSNILECFDDIGNLNIFLFNSHPRFPFCKRVSHFESDLQILYPTFHFCNDFPVFSLAFMI